MEFVALRCFFLKREQNYKRVVVKIVILLSELQSVSQMYVLKRIELKSVVHFQGFPCIPHKVKLL